MFSKVLDLGLCPRPRDLSLCPNPEAGGSGSLATNETGCPKKGHPASVLGPGSALGSLPSVALSSAQVSCRIDRTEKQ